MQPSIQLKHPPGMLLSKKYLHQYQSNIDSLYNLFFAENFTNSHFDHNLWQYQISSKHCHYFSIENEDHSPISLQDNGLGLYLLFGFNEGSLKVLMVKHGEGISKGKWALPGGWINYNESIDDAAARILKALTGVSNIYL